MYFYKKKIMGLFLDFFLSIFRLFFLQFLFLQEKENKIDIRRIAFGGKKFERRQPASVVMAAAYANQNRTFYQAAPTNAYPSVRVRPADVVVVPNDKLVFNVLEEGPDESLARATLSIHNPTDNNVIFKFRSNATGTTKVGVRPCIGQIMPGDKVDAVVEIAYADKFSVEDLKVLAVTAPASPQNEAGLREIWKILPSDVQTVTTVKCVINAPEPVPAQKYFTSHNWKQPPANWNTVAPPPEQRRAGPGGGGPMMSPIPPTRGRQQRQSPQHQQQQQQPTTSRYSNQRGGGQQHQPRFSYQEIVPNCTPVMGPGPTATPARQGYDGYQQSAPHQGQTFSPGYYSSRTGDPRQSSHPPEMQHAQMPPTSSYYVDTSSVMPNNSAVAKAGVAGGNLTNFLAQMDKGSLFQVGLLVIMGLAAMGLWQ
jgi:hypothetical protein